LKKKYFKGSISKFDTYLMDYHLILVVTDQTNISNDKIISVSGDPEEKNKNSCSSQKGSTLTTCSSELPHDFWNENNFWSCPIR